MLAEAVVDSSIPPRPGTRAIAALVRQNSHGWGPGGSAHAVFCLLDGDVMVTGVGVDPVLVKAVAYRRKDLTVPINHLLGPC